MIFPALLSVTALFQAAQVPPSYLPKSPTTGTVLAKVNGVPIRTGDVDRLLWDWAGPEVTNDLILFQLIRDRAAMDKITVTAAEIQKTFDTQMAEIQKQVPPGQDLDAFLRSKGFPKSRLYLHVQADLLITKIVDLKFKPTDYISVSTLVVKPKSAETPTDPKTPPQPKPVKTGPDATGMQEATGRAMDVYNRLKKGEDWDKVLATTDQMPQTVQTHGALGWRAIDAFPPATKIEFRTLKLHEYTKPIQTNNGLQIFRIDGFGANADPSALADLKKQFEDRAKNSLIPELQKAAKIEKFFPPEPPHKAAGKLGIEDKKVGAGLPVASGDEVTVIYTGRLTTGQVFDTNNKPGGTPFKFVVGAGKVIKGWDMGLIGMKKGGQRKLTIPYTLAYGEQVMPGIPAESDLVFDVEVTDIQKPKGH